MTLDEYYREAVDRVGRLDQELAELRLARSEDNADDEHDPEGSTLSSDWSRLEGLRAEATERLAEAEAAVARRADGTYGTCITCGRPIPPARLAVRPAAAQCVSCAR
jgi:RNA polymerase-binding transcription factor DksA